MSSVRWKRVCGRRAGSYADQTSKALRTGTLASLGRRGRLGLSRLGARRSVAVVPEFGGCLDAALTCRTASSTGDRASTPQKLPTNGAIKLGGWFGLATAIVAWYASTRGHELDVRPGGVARLAADTLTVRAAPRGRLG